MATFDLISAGQHIGETFAKADSTSGMNAKIAELASSQKLNREQTKRVIEEANKSCYLEKFRLSGEQVFDAANYDDVSSILSPQEEPLAKVASDESVAYTGNNYYGQKYAMVKVAEARRKATIVKCESELKTMTGKFDSWIQKIAHNNQDLRNMSYREVLDYVATQEGAEKVAEKLNEVYGQIKNLYSVREGLVKKAFVGTIVGGATRMGVSGLGFGLRTGANTAAKATEYAIRSGKWALTAGSKNPVGAAISRASTGWSAIDSARRAVPTSPNVMTNFSKTGEMQKDAFLGGVAKSISPHLPVIMAGIGTAAWGSKKLGDMLSRQRTKKDMERNYAAVIAVNPDLANSPNTRSYFETIGNFSPTIAKDPNTLSQLLKQFSAFDGVDLNTIQTLRQIENNVPAPVRGGFGTETTITSKRDNATGKTTFDTVRKISLS